MRAGTVKIEPAWLDAVFAQHLAERSVVDEEALGQTNPSKIRNLRRKVDSLKVVAARDSPELPSKAARVSGLF
jgi:hypothetical protein